VFDITMFTAVLMRVFESQPGRYDRDMNLLTMGAHGTIHGVIVAKTPSEGEICEIGCGDGTLLVRLASRSRRVVALDKSAEMVEFARKRVAGLDGRVQIDRRTALEMDRLFDADEFDCVIACLVFSEMTVEEQDWVLTECRRILKPGGKLLLADEFRPDGWLKNTISECCVVPVYLVGNIWLHLRRLATPSVWRTLYYSVVEMPLLLLSAAVSLPFGRPLPDLSRKLPVGMALLEQTKFRGNLRLLEIVRLAKDTV
jgi:demethylmenaquinone methyltransferase/2-methoxy-6-polyprenyl-1,4-benzoquinol methylase